MKPLKFISPLIVVSDIDKSKNFYVEILKQDIEFDFGENISFKGGFSIHLKSHYQNLIGNKIITNESNSFELYFEMNELEELTITLKENNVEFIHPIREEPWRQRVLRFYDPDRHIIEVGESIEFLCSRLLNQGMSVDEIASATSLSLEFVKKVVSPITPNS